MPSGDSGALLGECWVAGIANTAQELRSELRFFHLWARQGSNLRPRDYESPALTTELRALPGTVV